MENIKKMEMASALFEKNCIKVEKTCLGLFTKVTYTPTNSPVVGLCQEFDSANGQKVQEILSAASSELDRVEQKVGKLQVADNGCFRLSICFSKDHKFAALQIAQYTNFQYKPMGEVRFAEGEEAIKVLQPFVK